MSQNIAIVLTVVILISCSIGSSLLIDSIFAKEPAHYLSIFTGAAIGLCAMPVYRALCRHRRKKPRGFE